MSDRDQLKAQLLNALHRNYAEGLRERIGRDVRDSGEQPEAIEASLDRFAEGLIASAPADPYFVRAVLSGSVSDPEVVYRRYLEIVGASRNANTLAPYRPFGEVPLSTNEAPAIIYGPPSAMTAMSDWLNSNRGNAPGVALVTGQPMRKNVPVLPKFVRALISNRYSSISAPLTIPLAGGISLHFTSPFTCVVFQQGKDGARGSEIGKIDLTRDYVRAVANIAKENDLTEAFFLIVKELHDKVEKTVREIYDQLTQAAQNAQVLGGGLVHPDMLREIQGSMLPLSLQFHAAHEAFGKSHQLAGTWVGQLIGVQLREIYGNLLQRGIEITYAPPLLDLGSTQEAAVAMTVQRLHQILGAQGMMGLFDTRAPLDAYARSEALKESGVSVQVTSTGSGFGVFDAVMMRRVIFEVLRETIGIPQGLGNVGRRPKVHLAFCEDTQRFQVTSDRALPAALKKEILKVTEAAGFWGDIEFGTIPKSGNIPGKGIMTITLSYPDTGSGEDGSLSGAPDTVRTPRSRTSRSAVTTLPASSATDVTDVQGPPADSISGINDLASYERADSDTIPAPVPSEAETEDPPAVDGTDADALTPLTGITLPRVK